MLELTNETFANALKEHPLLLVDFYAVWCGPCKMLAPIVEEFAENHPNITLARLDVDNATETAITYGVMAMPTLLLFENGEIKETSVGLCDLDELETQFGKYDA